MIQYKYGADILFDPSATPDRSTVNITLSLFEEQILEQIRQLLQEEEVEEGFWALDVHFLGKLAYGSGWGGYRRNHQGTLHPYYPALNLTLGRLRSKGLVQRFDDTYFQERGYQTGQWRLTDQGRLLLGFA